MIKDLAATVAIAAWGVLAAGMLSLLGYSHWWGPWVSLCAIGAYWYLFAIFRKFNRIAGAKLAARWAGEQPPDDQTALDQTALDRFAEDMIKEAAKPS